MRKKLRRDILELVSSFQAQIKNKPPLPQMSTELRMMKFKIRPIQGDFSAVDLKDEDFIKALWSLGKLDEFFQKEYSRLTKKERQIFIRIFDDLYHQYQQELNRVNIYKGRLVGGDNKILEMEIFKENKGRKIN